MITLISVECETFRDRVELYTRKMFEGARRNLILSFNFRPPMRWELFINSGLPLIVFDCDISSEV